MPPKAKSQGESKQGLIITLVFFILATIGLGVSTYFGFADQEKKDKEVADAKKNEKLFKDERDYYKLQAELLRVYAGQGQNIDAAALGTRKGQFDQGTMKIDAYKDKDDVKKVLGEFDKRFGWDPKENRPKETFETELAKEREKYDALYKQFKGNETILAETRDKLKKADDEIREAKKTFETTLKEQANKNVEDLGTDRKMIQQLRDDILKIGAEKDEIRKKAEQDRQALDKQLKGKDEVIKHLNDRVKNLAERVAEYQVRTAEAPASMRSDWKIVRMDRRGTMPYINLGTADRVKPQLTFSIHGVGLDGRPIATPKGTLEVVNVIGDHLSQARITSVKDPNRDPILEGDVLYNASWNPTLKKHVALAGTMDLTGDGRDSLEEFKRNLERQNIVVDAWLDPKDASIKGEITLRTDYLILGESQEFSMTGREKSGEAQKRLELRRKELEAQAARNGVAVVPLHKYLEMIGYRLPRGVGEERRSLYDPSLRPDSGPRLGEKQPPPMMPDK